MTSNGRQEYFGVGADLTQLRADAKEAGNHFKEIGNTAVEAGNTIDKSFTKSTAQLKENIAEQKQLIAEIKNDIKNLSQAAKNPLNKDAVGDLAGAKKALAEEQATLLGLQKQKQEAAAAEMAGNAGIVKSLTKWMGALFTVGAALKIAKSVMESTEAASQKWQVLTEQSASATTYFFKTIASGDWSNFLEGLGKAIAGAKEYVMAMEDLNNRANEQKIKSSDLDEKIGRARSESFSTDPAVVKAALIKLIALQKEKLTGEAKIANDTYEFKKKRIAEENGMSQKALEDNIQYYTKNKKVIDEGERYNALQDELTKKRLSRKAMDRKGEVESADFLLKEEKRIQAEMEAIPNGAASGMAATKFGKVTFKERDELAELKAKAKTANAAIDINNRRDKQRLVGIEKQEEAERKANAEKALAERNRSIKEEGEYTTEIGKRRIAAAFEIEQLQLDIEKEGAEKRAKQADLIYKKTLSDLAIRKAEMIKRQNELSGGINAKTGKHSKSYNPNLPDEDQAQLDALAGLALTTKNGVETEFNKKAMEESRKAFETLYEQYKTLNNKRLDLERNYYADMKVLESGRTNANTRAVDLAKANRRKEFETEIQELQNAALKSTEFYQTLFGGFADKGFSSLTAFAKKANAVLGGATQYKDDKGKSMVTLQMPEIDATTGAMITKTVNITVEEYNRLIEKSKDLNDQLKKENPFNAIIKGLEAVASAVANKDVPALSDAMAQLGVATNNGLALLQDWSGSLRGIFGETTGDVTDGILQMIGGMADLGLGIGRIASGDIIGGITEAAQGIAAIVSQIVEVAEEERTEQANMMDAEIEYQRLLDERRIKLIESRSQLAAYTNDVELLNKLIAAGYIEAGAADYWSQMSDKLAAQQKAQTTELANQEKAYKSLLATKIEYVSGSIFSEGGTKTYYYSIASLIREMNDEEAAAYLARLRAGKSMTEAAKKYYDQWVAAGSKIETLKDDIASLYEEMASLATGLNFDSFLDEAMNQLVEAKGDVANFAEYTEETIKNALLNAFKYQFLAGQIQSLYDELASAMINGTADDTFVENWIKSYNEKVGGSWAQLQEIFTKAGLSVADISDTRSAATKGIATASQDSVDENNGRLTAIQGHTFQLVDITKSIAASAVVSVNYLAGIKKDTARLEAIENSVGAMQTALGDMSRNGIILRA